MEKSVIIILQRPQLAENVGMVIRAMANCGATELRLVNPVCGWPNPRAELVSAEKCDLVRVSCFENLREALSDLNLVFATSARPRNMIKSTCSPRECARICAQNILENRKIGIIFGPENNGLSNDDIALCRHVVCIESENFASYNLAQAVLIVCYSLMIELKSGPARAFHTGKTAVAAHAEIANFLDFLERQLCAKNYFRSPEKRAQMMLTLRNFFMRSEITTQEIQSLFGAVSALSTFTNSMEKNYD